MILSPSFMNSQNHSSKFVSQLPIFFLPKLQEKFGTEHLSLKLLTAS